ncbi:MAG: hypothetical protein ABIO06_03105 [Pseudolysinimonas sp.]
MTSTPTAPPAFDPRPLTEPIDPAVVTKWAPVFRQSHGIPDGLPREAVVGIVAASVGGGLCWLFGLFVLLIFPIAALILGIVGLIAVGLGLGIGLPLGFARRTELEQHWYRMAGFAQHNGLEYVPEVSAPGLPGMIFDLGQNRRTVDALRGTAPRFVEFGDYSYTVTTSNGKTTQTVTYRWGYVAIRLDVPLPNIVLDAVGNNGLFGSNLPIKLDKHQKLQLEGDFDSSFSLYCPPGYEADALYLFTPDVMARFVDDAAQLDVEIVDDWLILYRQGGFSTESPETWVWLFGVVGTLLDKLSQWGRWRDDRLAAALPTARAAVAPQAVASPIPDDAANRLPFAAPSPTSPATIPPPLPWPSRPLGVADTGRRLRRRFPVGAIIAISVTLAVVIVLPFVVVAIFLLQGAQ